MRLFLAPMAPAARPASALTEIRNFGLVQVMARRGRSGDLAAAAQAHFGVATPYGPTVVQAESAALIWSGPDQFLVLSRDGGDGALIEKLRQPFAGLASLTDQSHARAMIRIGGAAGARHAGKAVVDRPASVGFPAGRGGRDLDRPHQRQSVARQRFADGQAIFNLLVFATFAESLWHTILDAAAEYGVDVRLPEELVFPSPLVGEGGLAP